MPDDESPDLTTMDDPEFLAERRRIRIMVERTPPHERSPELTARYQRLNDEFDRRARAAWARAS
jgi:hypothetical protein